ncbi:LexA/Signal peptidase [Irpex rosettiformis]|uniref:LexA/Signal peptidase n=1 Tax=Irpex rosettiformis TaxID=378272 RepID=A0ACB8UDB1_9APHY|nr:LexA/Signal peptidase [Irpex rosettiformis]
MFRFRAALGSLRGSWAYLSKKYPRVRWSIGALYWLPVGMAFTEFGGKVMLVTGRSMQPTLNPDDSRSRDLVWFDRYSICVNRKYTRGDIVALKSPSDSKLIVKRMIALPGDVVKTLPPYPDTEVKIPEGHAWVEGDEPFHSEDSNTFGPVPLGLIDSRLDTILWPLDRYGPVINPDLTMEQQKRRAQNRGPAWRKEMDEFDRERRRQARVVKAEDSSMG